MARVLLEVPTILAPALQGQRSIEVEGATLREALEDAFLRNPALKVHLLDEAGDLRQHVLCFHNDVNTRWDDDAWDRELADGDSLTILQAVSGG